MKEFQRFVIFIFTTTKLMNKPRVELQGLCTQIVLGSSELFK